MTARQTREPDAIDQAIDLARSVHSIALLARATARLPDGSRAAERGWAQVERLIAALEASTQDMGGGEAGGTGGGAVRRDGRGRARVARGVTP